MLYAHSYEVLSSYRTVRSCSRIHTVPKRKGNVVGMVPDVYSGVLFGGVVKLPIAGNDYGVCFIFPPLSADFLQKTIRGEDFFGDGKVNGIYFVVMTFTERRNVRAVISMINVQT